MKSHSVIISHLDNLVDQLVQREQFLTKCICLASPDTSKEEISRMLNEQMAVRLQQLSLEAASLLITKFLLPTYDMSLWGRLKLMINFYHLKKKLALIRVVGDIRKEQFKLLNLSWMMCIKSL